MGLSISATKVGVKNSMAILGIWSIFLVMRYGFCNLLNKDELFFSQLRNKSFPVLVCLLGILWQANMLEMNKIFILGSVGSDFNSIDLLSQIRQCFILVPLLIIFSQMRGYFEENTSIFLLGGVFLALSSFNISIAFSIFVLYELFFVEKESKGNDSLRREMVTVLVVLFPFAIGLKGLFLGLFFLLLLVLNILEVTTFEQNCDRKGRGQIQYGQVILLFPLKMTLLAYCLSQGLEREYLILAKVILAILLVVVFIRGFFLLFNVKTRLEIVQILMLSSVLMAAEYSYMNIYFLLGLLSLCGIEDSYQEGDLLYPIMGSFILIALPFIDNGSGVVEVLSSFWKGDIFLVCLGVSIFLFMTMQALLWGHSLRRVGTLAMSTVDKYKGVVITVCIIVNARYNTALGGNGADLASKVILSFYFIIVLFASFTLNIPKVYFEKIAYFCSKVDVLPRSFKKGWTPLSRLECILRFLFRKVSLVAFFMQNVLTDTFFILIDAYANRKSRKYQNLAIFMLVVFLFFWMKIFTSD